MRIGQVENFQFFELNLEFFRCDLPIFEKDAEFVDLQLQQATTQTDKPKRGERKLIADSVMIDHGRTAANSASARCIGPVTRDRISSGSTPFCSNMLTNMAALSAYSLTAVPSLPTSKNNSASLPVLGKRLAVARKRKPSCQKVTVMLARRFGRRC